MFHPPITATEADALFAPWRALPVLVVAVSGGPDSVALLWLLARWRRALPDGPYLVAATIDHGLRAEAAQEAGDVKRLATALGLPHIVKRWRGAKPATGVPAAARAARYALLAQVARQHRAQHIVTAHTQDDQAETVLMRLLRGSGLIGLKAMMPEAAHGPVTIVRPLLGIAKTRLVATLTAEGITFADDPSNRDVAYTRPRLRKTLSTLAAEGLTADSLSRLASRLQRADRALESATSDVMRSVMLPASAGFDAELFAALPDEIRLRLLQKAVAAAGHERDAELGQLESLLSAIDTAPPAAGNGLRLRRTLAGALVTLTSGRLSVRPAPPRRPSQKATRP